MCFYDVYKLVIKPNISQAKFGSRENSQEMEIWLKKSQTPAYLYIPICCLTFEDTVQLRLLLNRELLPV